MTRPQPLSLVLSFGRRMRKSAAMISAMPSLPRLRVKLPLVNRPAYEAESTARPTLPHCLILVVDDIADAADTLALMLETEGHVAQAVHTAHEVLDRVQTFGPHAVLLDIGLPGMDGYEVARRIRNSGSHSDLKLIALTGYGQPEDRARALQAGFDEHLVKPVELAELLRTLAELHTCGGGSGGRPGFPAAAMESSRDI